MKVKIHFYQPPIPIPNSFQSPSRTMIISSLVLYFWKFLCKYIHIFFYKKYNFEGNQIDTHFDTYFPQTCFFHCCNIFIVQTYGSNLIFLTYFVGMYHICFATPQVIFKLSVICDHCRQCCTAHPYTHMQIFLWDR